VEHFMEHIADWDGTDRCYSDREQVAAVRYADDDACVRGFRKRAPAAIRAGDYRAFFEAAADCARAMNRREALVDEALVPVPRLPEEVTPAAA
jgi:hypothetical protein